MSNSTMHLNIIACVLSAKVENSTIVKHYATRDEALIGLGENFAILQALHFFEVYEPSLKKQSSMRFLSKENWHCLVCMSVEGPKLLIRMVHKH